MVSCRPEKPVAAWIDRERLGEETVPALTLILKSGGCGWNRCLMCGYRHFRYNLDEVSLADRIRDSSHGSGSGLTGRSTAW